MAGRYLISETPIVLCKLLPGVGTTIAVYDMAGVLIVLPPGDDTCTEIAATGMFVWDTSLLPAGTISTTGMTKLLFVMDNLAFTVEDTMEWGGWMDRVLGLVGENSIIDSTSFHATFGGLTSARMRIYKDGETVGGGTGIVATEDMTAVPTAINEYSSFKMEKQP